MSHMLKAIVAGVLMLATPLAAQAAPGVPTADLATLPADPEAASEPPITTPGEEVSEATVAETVVDPVFAAPVAGVGMPDGRMGFQDQYTELGRDFLWFHNALLLPIIAVISLFVLGLMIWVIVRYRRAAHPTPSRTTHNTALEVAWTLVPVLILVGIAVPSISLLARQYSPPAADITIKAVGNQWYWTYQYPDHGDFEIVSNMLSDEEAAANGEPRLLAVDERLVVPTGATVKVIVTSNDVIHSFGIPSLWTKIDAVPGHLNETWFEIDRPGVYYGQCYELCGARHAYMPIAVEAMEPANFARWVAAKGGTMPGAAETRLPPVLEAEAEQDGDVGGDDTDEAEVDADAAPAATEI